MTTHILDYLKQAVCSASPNHGVTPIEIQRWEDDGGAILADRPPRPQHCERHVHDAPHELAPAE